MNVRPSGGSPERGGRVRRGAARLLALGALVPVVTLIVATPAFADVNAVTGSAFGASATVDSVVDVTVAPTPTVTLPADGTAQTATLANVTAAPVLRTAVLDVDTVGVIGPGGSVNSSAVVNNVRVGGAGAVVLRADTISSACVSDETGSTGTSTIENLQVLGAPLTVSTAPNTVVTIAGVGTLNVNEQVVTGTAPSSSIIVNALRLELDVPVLGTGQIIIAQSQCGVTGTGVVVPTGAVGGVLLTGLVAVAFGGHQLRRRLRGPQAGTA